MNLFVTFSHVTLFPLLQKVYQMALFDLLFPTMCISFFLIRIFFDKKMICAFVPVSAYDLNTTVGRKKSYATLYVETYEFSHPFEPPVEACTSFYIGILAQKATRLGRL
jgi:hypothetical protein